MGGVDIDSRSFVSRSLVSFSNASRFGAGKSGGGRTYTAWTGLIHRGGACRMTDDRLFFLVEKKKKNSVLRFFAARSCRITLGSIRKCESVSIVSLSSFRGIVVDPLRSRLHYHSRFILK